MIAAIDSKTINDTADTVSPLREDRGILVEPAFQISSCKRLNIAADGWEDKASRYLAHAVSRAPADLRSHVQRINMHIQQKEAEQLFGALVDLFITLSEKGRSLRKLMLDNSRTTLGERRFQTLSRRLIKGINATDAFAQCRYSLLSKGITEAGLLVIKQHTDRSPVSRDPLEEACDYMEYGEVLEAQRVLEHAIFEQPHRLELHLELIEIYRHTRAKEQFFVTYMELQTSSIPVPEAWDRLASFFAEDE